MGMHLKNTSFAKNIIFVVFFFICFLLFFFLLFFLDLISHIFNEGPEVLQ